jgi:uncharacterized protein (TIGR02391 family)
MRAAFSNGGPRHDPEMDRGESDSLRELFTGTIGLFKNPASHRPVDYTDLDEATEVILIADLLLRVLDRQIGRLALRVAASGD